ncbi:unnamed protein product [Brassica napus]|uniref:(rape) hypothetical protein n=1 Tax=Brassica napus TaxID=3708 RepID=A0A816V956_BRANA|nr:unnamed protein product [Brassica napus]
MASRLSLFFSYIITGFGLKHTEIDLESRHSSWSLFSRMQRLAQGQNEEIEKVNRERKYHKKPQTLLLLNSNHFCHPILSQFILQTHKERKREEESLFRYSLTIATKFRIKEDINFAGSSFV